ncbi:DNA primase [Anaerosporobacter mobilis DSM 15930]|jgi:DNA primase|uniref:DNA primase n=1 Tax=Anaerosporobacter mobilis DSM 15930 TaxID=1120996 RepID=A0A1M7JZV5_9FIRM|nr:DNA primase [Anaerosporobacter mobilis]SHM58612.1 DNA primase [Anaerosporobacter mobilis DSM 15930]
MYYPEDLVEEIRQRNDIVDVVSEHVKLKRTGNNHMGLCPFHNEKSPSFSVSGQKQMYHCFGCGVGGNVFTFVMEYENYSFVEALKYLAERVNITLPEQEYSEEAKKKKDLKGQLLEINRQAAKYFFYQLKSERGTIAYEYLTNRKLSDETISKFGLGYSNKYSNDLYQYLKQLGYSDEILKQSGLVSIDETKGAYDKFWNRVMFPIMDVNNRVIGFGGRVMGEGEPKYLNSPETLLFDKSRNLYGLNVARTSRKHNMLICEGYMDVIALHQAGFNNAVASLGTAFTGLQANLLKRYTSEVLLTYDSDGAGTKAALRAIPILKEAGLSIKVINMQPYKDPDEFIKALGADEFQKRIDEAQNSFYFEIEVLERDYDLNDPEQKTKFFNEVAKKLLVFTEEIERNNYIEAMDRKYHVGFDNLRKLVNHYGATLVPTQTVIKKVQERSNKRVTAEDSMKQASKLLLTWMIEDIRLFQKLNGVISEKDFDGELYQTVARMLFQQYKEQGQVIPAKIINQFESKEEQSEVASLFSTTFQEEMSMLEKEKALNDLVYRIKKYSLDLRSRNVTDIEQMQSLIKEQVDLQKLHISLIDG